MKEYKYALISFLIVLLSVSLFIWYDRSKGGAIEFTPEVNPDIFPISSPIFRLGNTNVNHITNNVPGSVIIPLDKVTEYEIKAKKPLIMKRGKGESFGTIAVIPEGSIMKREELYANEWARVTYRGKTGYIQADRASALTLPVVWTEASEWARIDREKPRKMGGVSAVENALAQLMKPYEWGAEGPEDYDLDGDMRESFDCSGLTQWAYHEAGIEIPRTTELGYDKGVKIGRDDIQIGDLIYFNPPSESSPVSHVALYIGDNMMLHATGAFMKTGISEVYWDRMVSIRRYE